VTGHHDAERVLAVRAADSAACIGVFDLPRDVCVRTFGAVPEKKWGQSHIFMINSTLTPFNFNNINALKNVPLPESRREVRRNAAFKAHRMA
jgi:hypothetical protein